MTQQEKNQRLCERAGWKSLEGKHHPEIVNAGCMISPKGGLRVPPNLFESLDAVHEVEEKALNVRGMATIVQGVWVNMLQKVCFNPPPCSGNHAIELLARATAAQRAEALGLTLGLWKEGE